MIDLQRDLFGIRMNSLSARKAFCIRFAAAESRRWSTNFVGAPKFLTLSIRPRSCARPLATGGRPPDSENGINIFSSNASLTPLY